MIHRVVAVVAALCIGCLVLASPAAAQPFFGVRGGVNADAGGPNQFSVGGHVETGRLGQLKIMSFRPNVEIGIGDDLTLVSGNVEFVAWVPFNTAWSSYLGGGPSVNLMKFTGADLQVGGGFNILIGFQHAAGLFMEIKTGVSGDSPGLRGTVGYVFKR